MRDLIIAALPYDLSVPTAALALLAFVLTLALILAGLWLALWVTSYAAARKPHPSRLTVVRNAQGE